MTIPSQDAAGSAASLGLGRQDEMYRVLTVLSTEQFGVLATATTEQLHTSTILFAVTNAWEIVFAIRPVTLKARLAAEWPRAAFQVDNRSVVTSDRQAFVRLEFLGALRLVAADDPRRPDYHDIFAAKFPFGATLLADPEIALYVLTPERLRVAIGAGPPQDVDVPAPPAPEVAEPEA